MIAHLLKTAALSAALLAAPAFAKNHKHVKHHATRKHARSAGRRAPTRHTELAKADSDTPPAPVATHEAATDENGEAMPSGSRRVVTHSTYDPAADRTE
ncbi:MAG: hypothetical protein ACYDCL_07720 [Myxococcales bacterium]